MPTIFRIMFGFLMIGCLSWPAVTRADSPDSVTSPYNVTSIVAAYSGGGYAELEALLEALADTADENALPLLDLLEAGVLRTRKSDGRLVVATENDDDFVLTDPLTGEALGVAGKRELKKVRVNNRIRRAISSARGTLTLASADPEIREAAAQAVFRARDAAALETLRSAIERETDAGVLTALQEAEAAIVLQTDTEDAEKIDAISVIVNRGDEDALSLLMGFAASSKGALKSAATAGVDKVQTRLDYLGIVQNVWFGLSLGSVLLLAAIGLAITFGVMGVINMAHGELVMLGAYTTYVVQQVFRAYVPEAMDYSLLVALPAAFVVAGAAGVAIERGVIRFLYGRPLETLLATWGISLILQQSIRTIFGPSNVEVGAPTWMSGTVDVTAGLPLTLNRIWIVVFTLLVFAVLTFVIKRTTFGLQMRAVTQNRRMANSVGIRSNWVDAMTFGLGSGVAGIAGVALSQISNVSPNLGQSYIIDSFLVVVFGGVGNLWGTLVGAFSLGVANKFLEPWTGAVLAKIFILVAVILFIQRRPQGLFAQRGRAVEN
ncbi:MAG: urea ABC transporter permease subunit UrtB [Alphaproteobacteria bacterium]